MMVMQATEVELPGDVSAVTRRAACDGAGVDVLLTPAVVAALIPGSVAPLPKAVIHAFRARLAKQGMPDGAVFYDACATSPSETDRWMHGPMFIGWLRGARVFKAEAHADAKAAAELAIEAVERLMDNGGGVEAAVVPAAAAESATAPAPATAKATPASKPAPKRAAPKKKKTAVPSVKKQAKHPELDAAAVPPDGSVPRFVPEAAPPLPPAPQLRKEMQNSWAVQSDAEFCAAMAYAIETVRGRLPSLPRNSPREFRGEFRGAFGGEFRSLLSRERFSLLRLVAGGADHRPRGRRCDGTILRQPHQRKPVGSAHAAGAPVRAMLLLSIFLY